MNETCLLKLGGSLITDKEQPHTPLPHVIERLGSEIKYAMAQMPGLRLVIGHGSGSFGHVPAKKYGTRQGVHTLEQWQGFLEVWRDARALNQIVVECLSRAGLPVIAFPPSASLSTTDGMVSQWDLKPLTAALEAGLVPLINGDVVFDSLRGGIILSTEELFTHLVRHFQVSRILLAGIEPGVWEDFPARTRILSRITPGNLVKSSSALGGSTAVDVTGGMLKKVESMIDLITTMPGLQAQIFSGIVPGQAASVLLGAEVGTLICAT